MTAITVQLDDEMAQMLRRLAAAQQRSETDIVREALAAYAQTSRPLPKGIGKYHSGRHDVSEKARDLLRDAAKEGLWP
jgi:predicted transcriptional regulator